MRRFLFTILLYLPFYQVAHALQFPSVAPTNSTSVINLLALSVQHPLPQGTVRNNTQDVELKVSPLQLGKDKPIATWEVRLNDQVIFTGKTLPKRLYPVYRGTHKLAISGFDKDGKLIAKSPEIEFYKHQARIK